MTDDREHCFNCGGTYDQETGDHLDDGECVCCECCCECMACLYGPRDGVGLTEAQRAPARAFLEGGAR